MKDKEWIESIYPLIIFIVAILMILIVIIIKLKLYGKDLENLKEKVESTVSSDENITYLPRCDEDFGVLE